MQNLRQKEFCASVHNKQNQATELQTGPEFRQVRKGTSELTFPKAMPFHLSQSCGAVPDSLPGSHPGQLPEDQHDPGLSQLPGEEVCCSTGSTACRPAARDNLQLRLAVKGWTPRHSNRLLSLAFKTRASACQNCLRTNSPVLLTPPLQSPQEDVSASLTTVAAISGKTARSLFIFSRGHKSPPGD